MINLIFYQGDTIARDPGNSLNKAKLLTLGSNGAQFSDKVGGSDRADFFKINFTQRSSLNATLGKLKAKIKIKLFNTNGQLVGQSKKRATGVGQPQAQQQRRNGGQHLHPSRH